MGSSWGAGPAVAPEMANAEERVTRALPGAGLCTSGRRGRLRGGAP